MRVDSSTSQTTLGGAQDNAKETTQVEGAQPSRETSSYTEVGDAQNSPTNYDGKPKTGTGGPFGPSMPW